MQLMPLDLASFALSDWQQCRWHRGMRYYDVHLQQDLWGEWLLIRTWGYRDRGQGRTVHTYCESYGQAATILYRTIQRRDREGYRPVTPMPEALN